MKIERGTVKKPAGKIFETQYGDKRMMVVTMQSGEEEKFYLKPGHPGCNLKRDEPVTVVFEMRDGKQTRRLVIDEEPPVPTVPARTNTSNNYVPSTSNSSGNNILPTRQLNPREWARTQATTIMELMSIVSESASTGGFPDLPLEEIRNIAISIKIQADRQFNNGFELLNENQIEDLKASLEPESDDDDSLPY